jgi:hypothetical protein
MSNLVIERLVAAHCLVSHSNANSTICMLEDPLEGRKNVMVSGGLLLLLLVMCDQLGEALGNSASLFEDAQCWRSWYRSRGGNRS